jgi:hypothetical protein
MRPEKLTRREKSVITREAVVFAFFLLLSFVFWYLKTLEKEIEGDIRYPVKFINLPKQRVVSEDQVKLNFFLKGPGYSLLKLKVSGRKPPVVIDISKINYKRVPESKDPDYYIVTSGLIKSFTVQLRSECEITAIKPDTLFFTIEKAPSEALKKTTAEKVITNRKEQAPSK